VKTVLVTGAGGFVGKNLTEALRRREGVRLIGVDVDADDGEWKRGLDEADVIFHLAGVNRPRQEGEFALVNEGVTERILLHLEKCDQHPLILFASSIQALNDNPYGRSKKRAEEMIASFCAKHGGNAFIYRLKNVFGKWCRPNYNSVVATFCHSIACGEPITVDDPNKVLELVYIDDVVRSMLDSAFSRKQPCGAEYVEVELSFRTTVGQLAERISSFRDMRDSLLIPDMSDAFARRLYATYLSYHAGQAVSYQLQIKSDNRGSLAELFKSPTFGQLFISRTKPGIVRGNHYHNSKAEKFVVVQGEAVIRFRHIADNTTFDVRVRGEDFRIVDIPPGYTHSIENLSDGEMVVLFWANEIFDPHSTDTYPAEV